MNCGCAPEMSSPPRCDASGFPFPAHLTPGRAMVGDPAVAIGGNRRVAQCAGTNGSLRTSPPVVLGVCYARCCMFCGRVARRFVGMQHRSNLNMHFRIGAIAVVTLDIASDATDAVLSELGHAVCRSWRGGGGRWPG